MRGVQFESVQAAQEEACRIMHAIPVPVMNEAMDDLARRWQKCIDSRGHYFEGNIAPGPESEAESSESELDSDSDTE